MRASPRSSTETRLRGARLGLLALVTLFGLISHPSTAATSAELRGRARAELADGRYQRELPTADSPRQRRSGTPSRLPKVPGGGGPALEPEADAVFPPLAGFEVLARIVLWALLAAALLLVLLWVVENRQERRRAVAETPPPQPTTEKTPDRATPGDPAGLAAEGRYGEAVHALLMAAIALLSRRFRLPLPPTRTSRELLCALPLQGAAREAVAGLVGTVERSWFGAAAIGPEEYAASVERFRAVEAREG